MDSSSDRDKKRPVLDIYLHYYLVKKNLHRTAESFRQEAQISGDYPDLQGIIYEWWYLTFAKLNQQSFNLGLPTRIDPAIDDEQTIIPPIPGHHQKGVSGVNSMPLNERSTDVSGIISLSLKIL
ncbi:hypothetical protein ACOSQ3_012219 [Xanthoceras sorbifolium]